ncbi:MAG: efflux RND transporter periplasmic adaptor subunit [Thermoguttaceae bacterium]|jgi:RND family efflux transporter MFP subunit
MRYPSTFLAGFALVLGYCLGPTGCSRAPSETPPTEPVTVTVSYPVERNVTDYADFTARIAAVDSVEVRAHVWGYLEKVNFKEGTLVKKGDVLFELDQRPYQAEYGRALASLTQAKAHLTRTTADFRRADELLPKKAISQSDYDLARGDRDEAAAAVMVAEAALHTAKLNLDFTTVTAPISGRVSRYFVTVGNLIQSADQANVTLLTTIVSVDPMYACFDVDERTVQRVRQWLRNGKADSAADTGLPVALGLATEEGFFHQGTINFVDNQVNPKTGTLRVRGVFPNKDEALSAGFFARVRVPVGPPHPALLVSDRAIDNDQGQKILYVANDKNEVVSRPIRVGSLHDGLREIEEGLKPGERVIVNGLQTVRPGVTVQPQVVDMPKSNPKSEKRPRQIQMSASH